MRVNLNENQFIDIAVRKEENLIVYYADGIKIGVLDPNKMPVGMTNILMVNTQKLDITAEQMGQLQNAINAIPREDIEKEAQINKEIEEYIDLSEKKVYILDATAALYMIPIDRYNKNYDLFLIGNLGKDGEEGQIKNIKKDTEKVYLIMNDKNRRNWQNPERVRKYIIKNKQKIDEIGVFDVYE